MSEPYSLALLIEGNLDEAVGRRLARTLGFEVTTVYGKRGCHYIQAKISGFNASAISTPVLALVDFMDTNEPCPPQVVSKWLRGQRRATMLFRVVVREIESWLLADPYNLADFLHAPLSKVPKKPEELDDPKLEVIRLARLSRSSAMRRLLVPAASSTAREGPAYTSEMCRFVQNFWNPETARTNAPSLARCLAALAKLRQSGPS